jgi:hypothetical protein
MKCCGTVRPNRKAMTKVTGQKTKLKRGDVHIRGSCNLTTMTSKGKRNVNILTNMLFRPAEVDLYYGYGKSPRPVILASCGSKLSHRLFRLTLARDLIQETWRVTRTQATRKERQAPFISQLTDLTQDNKHCRLEGRRTGCHPCVSGECSMGLCATLFFEI